MADDFPDIHHKLCKKLATLVTIFYHLNTKSDENDMIQKNIIKAYEEEMDKIVNSANQVIEKHIKENAQTLELYEIRNAYQTFKSKIEEERILTTREFNDFKEISLKKERTMQEEAQKQLNSYQTEVEDLKEKIWQLQKLLEKTFGSEIKFDNQDRRAREIEFERMEIELKEKTREAGELGMKYVELERMYRELEEAYLMTERRSLNNIIEHNAELFNNGVRQEDWGEMLRRKVIEQEKLIIALKRRSGNGNGLLDGTEVPSIEIATETNQDTSNMSVQLSHMQREKLVSERLIQEKNTEIEKLREKLKENADDELKEVKKAHKKQIELIINEHNETMAELETEFKEEILRLETIIKGMQTTLDARNEYIAGLEQKLRSVEALKGNMEEEIKTLKTPRSDSPRNQEIFRLKEVKAKLEQSLEEERRRAEEEKARLREELKNDKERSIDALREELLNKKRPSEIEKENRIKELEVQIEILKQYPQKEVEKRANELAEDYQNKLNELNQKHNMLLRDAMEQNEERIEHLKKKYEDELDELKKELEKEKEYVARMKEEDKMSEVMRVKKDYEARFQKISKSYDLQLDEKLHEFESKLKKKDLEIDGLRDEIDKIKGDLLIGRENLKQKEAEKKSLETVIKELQNKNESLQEEIEKKFLEGESENLSHELSKYKEGGYNNDKNPQEVVENHLRYAERMERRFKDLKRQMEQKGQILSEKYSELLAAFEQRPSREEDLALIRYLEEEIRRLSEAIRVNTLENKKDVYPSPSGLSSVLIKKTGKVPSINPTLPPIAVVQVQMNHRTPPGATINKKFFK